MNTQPARLTAYGPQIAFDLEDTSGVAVVRRAGVELARQLNFDEARSGQVALVITEAATNILKHAGFGQILLRTLNWGAYAAVEVVALDKGPGIADLDWHAEDGNSTVGSYGIGLGALRRLSHAFGIYAEPGKGTVLWMQVWADEAPAALPWEVGAVCVPVNGEEVCGDNWMVVTRGDHFNWIIADGLGHGLGAATAANAAVELITNADDAPASVLQRAHGALQHTRGAAVAVGQINREKGQLSFAGVGNIAACIQRDQGVRHLISHNGIVGSNLRKVQEFFEPWDDDSVLVAHSDGISTRWNILSYPQLIHCHPAVIAAVIYRDFSRGRDDATILVVREAQA